MTKMTYVDALSYVLTNCSDIPAEVTEKLTALKTLEVLRSALEPLTTTEIMARDKELIPRDTTDEWKDAFNVCRLAR